MKLLLVAVGTRMPAWVDTAFDDFAKRMPRELPIQLVEVKAEPRRRLDLLQPRPPIPRAPAGLRQGRELQRLRQHAGLRRRESPQERILG